MTKKFVLYTGTLCHLCEQAKAVIYPLLPPGANLGEINIDGDPALKARYGCSIPVFAVADEQGIVAEKHWPFTQGQIRRLLVSGQAE
jgi:hypothetical protein